MKRALIKQMAAEWRTNIWLILEMAVVSLAIWCLLAITWIGNKGYFQPRGFTPDYVYSISVREMQKNSPYYLPEFADNIYQDRDELMKRLRENPNVEYVSLHNNMLPYNFNFSGNTIGIEGMPDYIQYYANIREAQPDIIKILDIKSMTGKSQDELTGMLQRGEVLLSPNPYFEENYGDVRNLIGKRVKAYFSETPVKVGDIVENVRRNDYEPRSEGMLLRVFDPGQPEWGDIALKVKPGKGKIFEDDFKTDRSLTHLRNVYLTDLQLLTDIRDNIQAPIKVDNRLRVGMMAFLLITIFLGLLGSFWFRVQQRVGEIAIRKTFGASNKDIFSRIIGEGMLLLLAGLLLTSLCVWPFISKIIEETGEEWYSLLAFEAITGGFMAFGIIMSLWYPAWKALKIEPAIAVKEQ